MSEYIPKYPSEEGDDSNKTSSELLAETLKPIYVPQELMLAWESHLASYSRDTHVLLDQVKDSELALNTKYQALLARVQKYEQMLQDITMDSNEFTMDTDIVNFTGWNILAQASYWDYLLRKEITKLSDQIKSAEFKGSLVADVSNSVLENLSKGNEHISNIIGALTDSPLIRDLDAALSGTSTGLSELRIEHERLKAKQYADAIALADQNGETFDQLTLTFNNLISEQIDKIADEAATRTRVFQELEDGITVESQLRHEGQETIATHVFALKASTETAIAGIEQKYSTIAGTEEAITTALTTYTAEVDGTIATILTDYIAYANLDSALTSKSDKLLAIVNENIGKLNITNEIQAGLTSIKALSTVSVDLNGVVSGYGLISELENGIVKSAFGVNADTFYIGKPTDAVKPFVVTTSPTTIDGIDFPAGTWINSAIIADATIGSAHITDAAITTAKIKDASITDAKITNLSANKLTVPSAKPFDSKANISDVLITGTVTNATALFDGLFKFGSSVCSFGQGNGTENVFLQLDFKEERLIKDIVLWFDTSEGRTHKYKLLTSSDGISWKYLVGSPTYWAASSKPLLNAYGTYVDTATSTRSYSGLGLACRYIKIIGNGNDIDSSNKIYELEVFSEYSNLVIDGNGIIANSVRAEALQVTDLSAVSANLGTIKVDSANIEDLAVTTLKIGNRAVTSSITQTQALNWSVNARVASSYEYSQTHSKQYTLYGFENSTIGANALLFLQTDLTARTRGFGGPSPIAEVKISLGSTLLKTIPGILRYGGLRYKSTSSEGGGASLSISGEYNTSSVDEIGTYMFPFVITQEMINSNLILTIAVRFYIFNRDYEGNMYGDSYATITGSTLTTYLVEFKK